METANTALGVDIGGTGIKVAIVDTEKGELVSERLRGRTPQPSTPAAVIDSICGYHEQLNWQGPIGIGFPGLVKFGEVRRVPNLDQSWIGFDPVNGLQEKLGARVVVVGNDGDAAGLAEVRFGAGKGVLGTVVVVTLGTGIGTGVFRNGMLIPDTEFGHLEIDGQEAETTTSNSLREKEDLSWEKWGEKVDRYLKHLEYLLGVDLFIIGGGVSKKSEQFFPYLASVTCKIVPASMGNAAGIVGAALFTQHDAHQ